MDSVGPMNDKDGNCYNRVPDAISDHIVNYYIRNAAVMLNDTNIRTAAANSRRAVAFKNLIAEVRHSFGYEITEKKIRNHFDHLRSKVKSKGLAFKKAAISEKRYRSKTGGGISRREEEILEAQGKYPFNTRAEEQIWTYLDGTPAVDAFPEGESRVGKTKSSQKTALHLTDHANYSRRYSPDIRLDSDEGGLGREHDGYSPDAEVQPCMDDFRDDSDGSNTEFEHLSSAPISRRRRQIRVTEAELLQEQFSLCQEQRQFFREMSHTMHEMCSFIKICEDRLFEQNCTRSHTDDNNNGGTCADKNIEDSLISTSLV